MRIVSDNIQLIRPSLRNALFQKDEAFITREVLRILASGCDAIDLNLGPLKKEGPQAIPYLIDRVRGVTHLPLFIDSPDAALAEIALKTGHSAIHINGFSLKPERLNAFLPLMQRHPESLFVGYLLSPEGSVPTSPDGRLQEAAALFKAVGEKGGHMLDRLVVDPVVVPLLWDDGAFQAMEVLRTLRHLPELAGQPIKTMAGLSNLTSGNVPLKKRALMERAYIPLLAEAGLDYLLMNTNRRESIQVVQAANLLTDKRPFSWAALAV